MSDDLEFIVIDDIPEYIFCIGDDEENEQVIALSGKDGAFKYEKVAELPTSGEDGVLYLVPKSHTTQTASGNPINVNITDNAGKIESLKLDGDTYQQSYTGKNLFDVSATVIQGYINNNGAIERNTTSSVMIDEYYPFQAGDFTFSYDIVASGSFVRNIAFYDTSKVMLSRIQNSDPSSPITFTAPADTAFIRFNFYNANGMTPDNPLSTYLTNIQLESGSSATSYEPYCGGVPSPSPSYPQQIQTVTGEQTVSINGTDYSIDLGSIELCKLGSYQDYIYKSGDDWKVHKAIATITVDGSEDWAYSGDNKFSANNINGMAMPVNANAVCYCSTHIGVLSAGSGAAFTPLVADKPYATDVHKTATMVRFKDIRFTTTTELESWLSQNNTTIYYVVATATDTTITDTNLIAQLEAIRTAALESGSNTISNTATGTNLAGDLEIGYYGYDPLNKYDKYFWLDVDGEYESI